MGAWQQAGFALDRAHLIQRTTVDPLAFFYHGATQHSGFQLFQRGTQIGIQQLLFGQSGFDGVFGGGHSGNALLLVGDRIGGAHLVFARCFHGVEQGRVIRSSEIKRLFRAIFGQINDQVDNRLDLLVGKIDCAQHLFFGQFVCFGFNHHHGVFGAGDNQIKALFGVVAQVLHVVHGGVQHVIAIHKTNAGAGDRATERCAGNGQRGRCCDHRHNIGIVFQIVRQHGAHHQNFVFEAGHEQRPDRTVDQARSQGFLLGGACLTFEEAAGHFTRSIVFFLVMNGQRKEILTFFLFAGKGHVGHDRGFTQRGDDRAIGLTGNLARFQCQRFIAPLHRFRRYVKHLSFPIRGHSRPSGSPVLHSGPIAADPFHHVMRRGQGVTSQMDGRIHGFGAE